MSVPGIVALVAVLAVATTLGLLRRRRQGVLRAVRPTAPVLSPADLGRPLGDRATLVQFSSAFCRPCVATRHVLDRTAGSLPGVEHIEVDAESNLELVRRLGVASTPTTLVLDGAGVEVRRATGVPRPAAVRAALEALPGVVR